ncbi:MAG: sel1 repeat family protein [Betaproteobacteria bacterium]|nr:sel1 repeat family protein [Betaproteobacteria bacterium]MDE2422752.1 sel1 repeat family protein [Betaproteobacteria bacterium]
MRYPNILKIIIAFSIVFFSLHLQAMENKLAQSLAFKAFQGNQAALKELKSAADVGDAVAQNWLGSYFREKHDFDHALFWFNKAAEQNNSVALNNLGFLFSEGYGVKADSPKALQYYKRSAELGNLDALNNLALMYAQGEGVKQSYREAYVWFEKAADKGDGLATANIGIYYAQGFGVQKNDTIAFALCKRAVLMGVGQAQRCKAELIKHMDQTQITRADQLTNRIQRVGVRNAINEYLSQSH